MQAKILACNTLEGETLIQVSIDNVELCQYIRAEDLAIAIRSRLANKIAGHLFEKIEPTIEKALRSKFNE